ncbi:MAG TPA: 3'-5' exonuclease, partial [Nitrospira sp.]
IMRAAALHRWPHRQAAALTMLYERLAGLRHAATVLPVPDVLNLLFEQLPLLELAATSLHGEQAVANLLKARDLAEEVADRPHLTLSGFVDLMMQRLADQPEEAESALAEASLDAVRILTIHKAKGLEFPVVVLPGLHQGSRTPQKGPAVHHDWSSRCYGLMLGSHSNLGAVLVKHKMSARETAEQRRLLYVGMTRARDLLVLSGGYTPKPGRDTVWGLLEQSLGEAVLSENSAVFDVGTVKISRTVLPAGASPRRRPFKTTPSVPTPVLEDLLARHRVRHDRWDFMRQTSKRLTPSLMMEHHNVFPATDVSTDGNETPGRLVGICTHAILEQWDFLRAAPPDAEEIEAVLRRFVPTAELPAGMRADILAIMRAFVASDFYSTMRRATILGREISFVMPWEESQIMEGVIDLMYRLDGRLWIADYKTDRISGSDAADRAKLYNQQAALYRMAATRCLGQPVGGFQFVFLRPGVTVEM